MLEITNSRSDSEITRPVHPDKAASAPEAQEEQAAPPPPQEDSFTPPEPESEVKTLLEQIKEAQERAEEQRKMFTIRRNTNYGDFPLAAYARLARARTKSDVSAASGYARRQAARLRTALRQDSENAERIKAAIAQLDKVSVRAARKKQDLNREALIAQRQEKAEEEERRREVLRLKAELQRRKTLRTFREGGYLHEAAIDDWSQAQRAVTRAEYELRAQEVAAPAANPTAAAQQYAAVASAPAAPPADAAAGLNLQA